MGLVGGVLSHFVKGGGAEVCMPGGTVYVEPTEEKGRFGGVP